VPKDDPLPDASRLAVAGPVQAVRRRRRLQLAVAVLGIAAVTSAGLALRGAGLTHIGISCACHPPYPVTASELSGAHWLVLPRSPLGPRSGPILAWTGQQLFEVGGTWHGAVKRSGAVFDPSAGRWRKIAPVPGPVGLAGAVAVATPGNRFRPQLFVAGGMAAGLYDPVANRWTTTDLPRQLAGSRLAAAVWTGYDVIVAGTSNSAARPKLAVAAYKVEDRRWRMITPRLPASHPTRAVSVVATLHHVMLWSMWSRRTSTANGGTILSGVDMLRLHDHIGQWTRMRRYWPQHRVVAGAAFADFQILIPPGQYWCGGCPARASLSPAKFADRQAMALTAIPASPLVTQPAVWLWNGNTVLAATESDYSQAAPDGRLRGLAAYDFYSHRWRVLRRVPSAPALAAAPIFAEQQLLVLTRDGSLLSLGKRP
jgi:hypothetical protein